MCSSGNRQTVICHKTKVRWSLFVPYPVVSSQTWSLPAEKNNQTSPTSSAIKDCCLSPSLPSFDRWSPGTRADRASSRGSTRSGCPRKEKQNWGWWGECVRDGAPGRVGGWNIDAKQSWQTRCKLSPRTIKHLSQLTVGDVWLIAIVSPKFSELDRLSWRAATRNFLDWRKSEMWQQRRQSREARQ